MTKSLFRALFAITGAALLAFTALPAAGATLTYNDPNCAGFQITGSGGSFTLTCAKLSCSIGGLTTPTTAQDTSLTATCSPSGASFLWSLVTGPFSHASCNAPSSPTGATTAIVRPTGIAAGQTRSCLYQVNGTAAGLSGQAMATVTWSDAPTAPPVCTPTATTVPTPIASGPGSVNLGAGCVPSAGVTYTWTRTAPTAGAPTNPTSSNPTDVLAQNTGVSDVIYTWQVVACTSPTTCDTKSISVSVSAPGGGGGGLSCTGFSKTILVDIPWSTATPANFYTADIGGFTPTTALVIRVGPAPLGTVLPRTGSVVGAEYGEPLTVRSAVVSPNPCDWSNTIGNPYAYLQETSTFHWSIGVDATASFSPNGATVAAGTPYYINVKNYRAAGGNTTCNYSTCNMVIKWIKPY